MIKIYIDQYKEERQDYVEDKYSAYEIVGMDKETFLDMIRYNYGGVIHTCYPEFINHYGRFVREFGLDWVHEKVEIYAKEKGDVYGQYVFNEKGQLEHWPYGFFGE